MGVTTSEAVCKGRLDPLIEMAAPLSQLCNQLSQRGHIYVGNLQSMINRLYRE